MMHSIPQPAAPRSRIAAILKGFIKLLIVVVVIGGLILFFFGAPDGGQQTGTPPGGQNGSQGAMGETTEKEQPRPVRVDSVALQDVPVYYTGLGTVTPINTVLVKSRADGQLMRLHFIEGQDVQAGDLLAEIDPRQYEVQLQQALGALARDAAQLRDAQLDLARYRKLAEEGSVSAQQLQKQEALVGQYEGAVQVNKAAIADAKLQLSYCKIVAPVSGRLGFKKVDVGNMIRAGDGSGLVTITQIKPTQVLFTIVERELPTVLEAMRTNAELTVEAWNQSNTELIATGIMATVDNTIDTSTGTVKAKATFANDDYRLYPSQFVNVKLLVNTLKEVLTVPISALQRDNKGHFVYLVSETREEGELVRRVKVQSVTLGYSTGTYTVIESGLQAGDVVVTDGVDRLRDGAPISF